MSQYKEEENKLAKKLDVSSVNESEINAYIVAPEASLKLTAQQKNTQNELVSYMQWYASRKNKNDVLLAVKKFSTDNTASFQIIEQGTKALLDYYKTGNEQHYLNYVDLRGKWEESRIKLKVSTEKLLYETVR